MRVVIAARLSATVDGQTGNETQTTNARLWADAQGHDVVAVVADHKSGTVQPWHRPNLRQWVTDPARMATYDAILAYKLDRLSRGDNASTNEIEAWAHANGKLLLTADGDVFPSEGTDGIRWDVAKRVAHQAWIDASERYSRMHAYLHSKGFAVGKAPYGYRITCSEGYTHIAPERCAHHKVFTPDDAESAAAMLMFTLYDGGVSLAGICSRLDADGVKPRVARNWTSVTLSQILRNQVYSTGRRTNAAGVTIDKLTPLVSADLQRRVINRLDNAPSKRGPEKGSPALLTSVLFCDKCHAPMYRIRSGRGMPAAYYYRCHGIGGKSSCRNMVRLPAVDGFLAFVLSQATEPWTETRVVPGANYDADIASVDGDITDATRALAAGTLDAGAFGARMGMLAAERVRLASLPAVKDEVRAVTTGETIGEHYASLDEPGRRKMLTDGVKVYVQRSTVSRTAGGKPEPMITARIVSKYHLGSDRQITVDGMTFSAVVTEEGKA